MIGRSMSRGSPGPLPALTATLGLAAVFVLSAACEDSSDGPGVASAGGKSSTATASASPADEQDQLLEFARCMRENGINMPDPQPGKEMRDLMRSAGTDRNKIRRVMEESCADRVPQSVRDRWNDPKRQDQLLAWARCMRDNGVNVPDPAGGVRPSFGNVDRDSPEFEKAMEQCSKHLGDRGPTPGSSPS